MYGKRREWTHCEYERFLKLNEYSLSWLLRFDFPTPLLSISQLGETAPLTSWFAQDANLAEDEMKDGEPMRE